MCKIHVLMCCHNGGKYVGQQLRSILEQSLPVEIVHVHDFNSVDGTVGCVAEVQSSTKTPIRLTRHLDAPGASLSFFRALNMLANDLNDEDIVFLADQDDVWLPQKVDTMVSLMRSERLSRNDLRLIFHDVVVVDEVLSVLRPTYYTGNPFAIPRDLHPDRLLLANPAIGHTMAISGALIKLVVSRATPVYYLMHDWALLLFASRFGVIGCVPSALSLYRQHSSNVLGAYGRRSAFQILGRLNRFSENVVLQAEGFMRDIGPIAFKSTVTVVDTLVMRFCKKNAAPGYVILGASALLYGPTIQRKGLALFIWAQAFVRAIKFTRAPQ